MKIIYAFIVIGLLFSCNNSDEEIHYYESGKIKSVKIEKDSIKFVYEYYESGVLQKITIYNKNSNISTYQCFSESGDLLTIDRKVDSIHHGYRLTMFKDGGLMYYCNYDSGKRFGDCIKYIDGYRLQYIRNFKKYGDEEYLNQDYEFSYNGTLQRENSDYVQVLGKKISDTKSIIKFYIPRDNSNKYEYQAILVHFRKNEVYKIDTAYFNKNEYEHIYDDVLNDGDYIKVSFWLYTITDTVNGKIQLVGRNIFFTLGSIDEYNIDERFILD